MEAAMKETPTFFIKKVDKRSRKAMIAYLSNHFRYNTMNSWNRSTSYAHCIKVHRLGLTSKQVDKAFDLVNAENFWDEFQYLIQDFNVDHDYQWQVGTNGRSGGYLVLYKGGWKYEEYKSYCTSCGQRNYKTIEETNDKTCGKCGQRTRINIKSPRIIPFTWPDKDIDMCEDFEDWDMDALKSRVQIVQKFDLLAEDMRGQLIYMIENYTINDESYLVSKTRKVIKEAA